VPNGCESARNSKTGIVEGTLLFTLLEVEGNQAFPFISVAEKLKFVPVVERARVLFVVFCVIDDS
jgi:hypothetical protein